MQLLESGARESESIALRRAAPRRGAPSILDQESGRGSESIGMGEGCLFCEARKSLSRNDQIPVGMLQKLKCNTFRKVAKCSYTSCFWTFSKLGFHDLSLHMKNDHDQKSKSH